MEEAMPFGLGLLVGRFVGWLDGCPVDGLMKNGLVPPYSSEGGPVTPFSIGPSLLRQLPAPQISSTSSTAATCPAVFLRRQIARGSRIYLDFISVPAPAVAVEVIDF